MTIEPTQVAALHLSTAPVDERDFVRTIRTVGTVVLDETRTAHVHVKVRGWIDRIFVNFVGQKVRAGEPLCTIYSQDIYSAELEYLSLLEGASIQPVADPLLAAARRRLSLWDVPKAEIDRLEKTRQVNRTFPLLAPRDGTVLAKEALQGMYVEPSAELYTLSDLSSVWVLADVYETDVPYVHLGDKAQLAVEGREAQLDATASFLYPTIDEASRTRKVRFVLPNPNGRLLPGAFVTVTMEAHLGKGLSVPESAVIRTGARSIVFVVHGEGAIHVEPREVTLGSLVGDRYRVDRGLQAGEKVATGAQFLLDSESRLRATSAPGGGHVH
jgi:Cu(I)/Ag(I) efflux system membrane fusion protein